jgi:lipoprotein-releasing system permease protein
VALSGNSSFSGLIIRIATVAVALSVGVMIIATALISGFKKEISAKLFGFQGHIHITDFETTQALEGRPIDTSAPYRFKLDSLEGIDVSYKGANGGLSSLFGKQKNGVRHVQAFIEKPSIFKAKDEIEGIILKGVGKDFDWAFMRQHLEEGDIIHLPDSAASSQVLISRQTAKRLDMRLGDKFLIYFINEAGSTRRRFEVCGIYNTGLAEKDERYALVDIRQLQRVNGWSETQATGLEVFLDDLNSLDGASEQIYELLPMNLYSQTIREKDADIFNWLELQNVNERVILGLMLLVCLINMATALLILILERTNMVGIMKALGSGNWAIQKIFLIYGAFITLLGLFFGNLLGIGLSLLQRQFGIIRLPEDDYYVSVAPIDLNLGTIMLLNLGVLVLVSLVLVVPSFLVRRITPVRAISFK